MAQRTARRLRLEAHRRLPVAQPGLRLLADGDGERALGGARAPEAIERPRLERLIGENLLVVVLAQQQPQVRDATPVLADPGGEGRRRLADAGLAGTQLDARRRPPAQES